MTVNAVADPAATIAQASPQRRSLWIRLMEIRIGITPRPVCLVLVARIAMAHFKIV